MHHAGAEHLHHLGEQRREDGARRVAVDPDVGQARRRRAAGVGDQLHHEDAVDEVVGLGYPHAGRPQAIDDVDLGRAPHRLVLDAAVAGVLAQRPLGAGVPHRAAFGVGGSLPEGAVLGRLVHLGHAQLAAGDDQVNLRLLAAHQRAHDLLDNPQVDKWCQALGMTHRSASVRHDGREVKRRRVGGRVVGRRVVQVHRAPAKMPVG